MGVNDAKEMLEVAKAEVAKLEAVIEQAPHSTGCAYFLPGTPYAIPCNCWKSHAGTGAALRERDAEKWDEGARAAYGGPDDEMSQRWLDARNPYRETS